MESERQNTVILRDMTESDIEDYVRWFIRDMDWKDWDAPWEEIETTEEEERRSWTEYYEAVRVLSVEDRVRWKFEIEWNGRHVGWVSMYFDLDYMDNPEKIPAVGIDIAEPDARGQGVGTEALRQFIDFLNGRGFPRVYTQTWSGNAAMLRCAEKLGFVEVFRKKDFRVVRGERYDAVTLLLVR